MPAQTFTKELRPDYSHTLVDGTVDDVHRLGRLMNKLNLSFADVLKIVRDDKPLAKVDVTSKPDGRRLAETKPLASPVISQPFVIDPLTVARQSNFEQMKSLRGATDPMTQAVLEDRARTMDCAAMIRDLMTAGAKAASAANTRARQ
jgi:hypothetical protein